MRIYKFKHDNQMAMTFEVDTTIFTTKDAIKIIDDYGWYRSSIMNPVDIVMRQFAITLTEFSDLHLGCSIESVIERFDFNNLPKLDGTRGITLIHYEDKRSDGPKLTVEISQ